MSSIKTTLAQIAKAVESRAIEHVSALVPPGAYQFRVAKLLDAVEREYNGFIKQRNALVRKYGVPQVVEKDGKQVPTGNIGLFGTTVENTIAYNDAMGTLLDEETTIPYEPIIWGKLGDEAKKLTVGDVSALGPLLVEDLPATEPTSK
jgi:hypothetical protein